MEPPTDVGKPTNRRWKRASLTLLRSTRSRRASWRLQGRRSSSAETFEDPSKVLLWIASMGPTTTIGGDLRRTHREGGPSRASMGPPIVVVGDS